MPRKEEVISNMEELTVEEFEALYPKYYDAMKRYLLSSISLEYNKIQRKGKEVSISTFLACIDEVRDDLAAYIAKISAETQKELYEKEKTLKTLEKKH